MPHFRDTWGSILHRRGKSARTLPHLEAAAAALPGNAQVQFHLGEAAFALGDRETARASFENALAAAATGVARCPRPRRGAPASPRSGRPRRTAEGSPGPSFA